MSWLDGLTLLVVGLSSLSGFGRGFARELAGLVGVLMGLLFAFRLCTPLAQELGRWLPLPVAGGASFVIIFLLVLLLTRPLGRALGAALKGIGLGWLDRLGGVFLGGGKGLFLIGFLARFGIGYLPGGDPLLLRSPLGQAAVRFAGMVLSLLAGVDWRAFEDGGHFV